MKLGKDLIPSRIYSRTDLIEVTMEWIVASSANWGDLIPPIVELLKIL